ncbi:MAG: hypothetical protein COC04_02130 [Gammaproteobacteria bacterium]|nr:hypothetical protein [Colwellia sp.]PCH65349.1 MAG: hypothetical protein COC04_02130 [Gammaproteobacteria bacterium]
MVEDFKIKILQQITIDVARMLFFRTFKPRSEWINYYLAFGLFFTWAAGVGRYWDNPRADLWQYLGLGSVGYIFVLAFLIWIINIPLKPHNWNYKNVLVFISLTSPPALLYAIPVERFLDLELAQKANVWFLAIVASWRVGLLGVFLNRSARLSGIAIIVGTLLPLVLIVSGLTALNLEHVVFKIMAGLEDHEKSVNDMAYFALMLITYFSIFASPILLIIYGALAYKAWKK